MRSTRTITILGALGPVLLIVLCLSSKFFPAGVDRLLRHEGLIVWLGVLAASFLLPTMAALCSSKWWLVVAAACLAAALFVFSALMA
jgi:hypothetical protein